MIESRWEVKIGAHVMATDGECGHLQKLLVDPLQERIVALLVQPHSLLPSPTFVVPEDLIADSSEHEVQLTISQEQADALPKFLSEAELFVENQLHVANDKMLGMRILAGQPVLCRDGFAGRTIMILTNPWGRVKGFVLQTGHLPITGRKVIVPITWVQKVDQENVHLFFYKSDLDDLADYMPDDHLAEKVDDVLWTDDVLRNTDYEDFDVSIQDGVVVLQGHVTSLTNKTRVEQIVRSVAGVLDVDNRLVIDQDLVVQVAQALAMDGLTRLERISVSAEKGVITLNGRVSSPYIREAAERIAVSVPQVRAVINTLHAPNLVIAPEEQPFWQPSILQKVYAQDMLVGQLEKVIINPRNRRVTAFVVHGIFPGRQNIHDPRLNGEDLQQERRVVIPTDAVRSESDSTVLLKVSGVEAAQYPDFNPATYRYPPAAWQPPYPYRGEEVLFENQNGGIEQC